MRLERLDEVSGIRNEVERRVRIRLADARANLFGIDEGLLSAFRHMAASEVLDDDEARSSCPACSSPAVVTGFRDVGALNHERDKDGDIVRPILSVVFYAESFHCPVCGLRLDSPPELEVAEVGTLYDEGPDRVEEFSQPYDEDSDYERRREDL